MTAVATSFFMTALISFKNTNLTLLDSHAYFQNARMVEIEEDIDIVQAILMSDGEIGEELDELEIEELLELLELLEFNELLKDVELDGIIEFSQFIVK